ncbi:MAG: hypothetical protein QM758_07460 [Armatimonas sp.]
MAQQTVRKDMAISDSLTLLRNFLWKVICPRAARMAEENRVYWELRKKRLARRMQRVERIVETLRKDEGDWLETAKNPKSTADDLRRVIANDNDLSMQIIKVKRRLLGDRGSFYQIYNNKYSWSCEFYKAVASHANFPFDLLGNEIYINAHSVSGLLQNPALPLILLECPEFLENLDRKKRTSLYSGNSSQFAYEVFQQAEIPLFLLQLLKNIKDPWFGLEAQTHITSDDFDTSTIPDINWLDAQVVDRLRSDTLQRRCLTYELAYYGILPKEIEPVPPWRDVAASVHEEPASDPDILEFVEETHKLARLGAEEREDTLLNRIRIELVQEDLHAQALKLEAVLLHPKTAHWVRTCIAKGWPHKRRYSSFWSLCRLMTILHGKPSDKVKAAFRFQAILEALKCWEEPLDNSERGSPGILYFMARDLPTLLEGSMLAQQYRDPRESYICGGTPVRMNLPESLSRTSFLVRLAVALRLDDAESEQDYCREQLCNDPNRYVRAAARKEISWPKAT